MRVAVEVCITSVDEAVAARDLGVDSVEACAWLACGGITPSSGLVDAVRSALHIPVRVLVRPTPTGFRYTSAESLVLLTDVEVFGGGALSLVTGALDDHGNLHRRLMEAVKRAAPESEITFHRAIDQASDPLQVVDDCIELGIDRILTSGGATLATDGVPVIQRIVQRAGHGCRVAMAGGVGPKNVVELVERTGAGEVHFAAQKAVGSAQRGAAMSSTNPGVDFHTEPDRAKIEGVLNALVKAGLR
jgi:copper homeostasis protein